MTNVLSYVDISLHFEYHLYMDRAEFERTGLSRIRAVCSRVAAVL